MRLGDLFPSAAPAAGRDTAIRALAFDHREVAPGTAFFCVRGLTRDGHDFAAEAVAAGAAALIVDHPLASDVPEVVVDDVRASMAPAAAALAGDPTAALTMIGITGTSGKTTTSYLTAALLAPDARQPGCGMVGTVATRIGGAEREAVRTTPEAIALQQTFAAMLRAGDTACVMEVSSHALTLHRADAIHWDVAAFTNLGHDHLDFHADEEEYFLAKRALFAAAAAEGATLIACSDDAHGRRLAHEFSGVITVGMGPEAGTRATDLDAGLTSTRFRLDGAAFTVPLPGRFNVQNALIAIATARALGHADSEIAARLADAGGVPGRFQPVDAGQDFGVIVDYAHKPEAVAQALVAARAIAGEHRVLCVLGAGGDRDTAKRPVMAAAAAEHADLVVLTSDNPRSEDPEAIIAAMAVGAPGAERIVDRRAAIERAISLAAAGDLVVIAGKGHEAYQEFAGGRTEPFDDRTVAREVLDARLGR